MTPKPRAKPRKKKTENNPVDNLTDMMDDLTEPGQNVTDPNAKAQEPKPNVLTPKKLQDATDMLVDGKPKYVIEEADHTWGPLIKLSADLLSPFEKKFVDDIKSNRLEKNVKNFSIACAIVGRYCD